MVCFPDDSAYYRSITGISTIRKLYTTGRNMLEVKTPGIPQRWQKKDYEGPIVYNVYLNNALTNVVRTDDTLERVKELMTNNNRIYDDIQRE